VSTLEEVAEAIAFAHAPDSNLTTGSLPQDFDELERIAALAAFASAPPETPPSTLASRLAADGLSFCASSDSHSQQTRDSQGATSAATPEMAGFITPIKKRSSNLTSFLLGALAAGILTWLSLADQPALSVGELRAAALASDATLQRQDWQPGPSPMSGKVSGDVVWNQTQQDGWLTFRNLPELEDGKAYQLWIVDGTREGAPVDGGVFQIAKTDQTTVVPIHARLQVGSPAAFVITVESSQGVVVSDQEHVVAIASL
jgi:hypothetical protein